MGNIKTYHIAGVNPTLMRYINTLIYQVDCGFTFIMSPNLNPEIIKAHLKVLGIKGYRFKKVYQGESGGLIPKDPDKRILKHIEITKS